MASSLRRSKKAIVFSLIALFMVFMLVLDFRVASRLHLEKNKISAQNTRIKVMNNFVVDLEERYLERMLFVASKAALADLSQRDVEDLKSEFVDKIKSGEGQFNLESLRITLEEKFEGVGLQIKRLEIKEDDTELGQLDPWTVQVNTTINYEVSDEEGLAGWRGKLKKSVDVNVYGFIADDTLITKDWKESNECSPGTCDQNFLERLDSAFSGGLFLFL